MTPLPTLTEIALVAASGLTPFFGALPVYPDEVRLAIVESDSVSVHRVRVGKIDGQTVFEIETDEDETVPTDEEVQAAARSLWADVPYMDEDPEYQGQGEDE